MKLLKPHLEVVPMVWENWPFPTETIQIGFAQEMNSSWNQEETETGFSPGKTPYVDLPRCRSVNHFHFSWTIYMYVLGMPYIAKLLIFLWVQTVRPLSRICFCTANQIHNPILLKHLTIVLVIWMIFLILTTRFLILCYPLIYPNELRLNKTNESNFSAPFLDLDLSIMGLFRLKFTTNGTILISL